MRLAIFAAILLCGEFVAPVVDAKIWYINDYQRELFYKGRVNEPPSARPNNQETFDCEEHSYKDMESLGADHTCAGTYTTPSKTCCSNWVCNSNFPYESCGSGKIPNGECTDKDGTVHYQSCICNTSTYKYTSSNCAYNLGGSSCNDGTIHYSECNQDPCDKAQGENACKTNCEYGCAAKYTGCASCCIECNSCSPNNCSAFPHIGSAPTGANEVETCQKGCGDTTNYYKVKSCKAGYDLQETGGVATCKAKTSCPAGYAISAANCGTPQYGNGKFSLGTEINGYVGETACKNCVLTCNTASGWEPNSSKTDCTAKICPTGFVVGFDEQISTKCPTDLGAAPTNGYYVVNTSVEDGMSAGAPCFKCEKTCSAGYTLSSKGNCCDVPTGYSATCPVADCDTNPNIQVFECVDGTKYYKYSVVAYDCSSASLRQNHIGAAFFSDAKCAYDSNYTGGQFLGVVGSLPRFIIWGGVDDLSFEEATTTCKNQGGLIFQHGMFALVDSCTTSYRPSNSTRKYNTMGTQTPYWSVKSASAPGVMTNSQCGNYPDLTASSFNEWPECPSAPFYCQAEFGEVLSLYTQFGENGLIILDNGLFVTAPEYIPGNNKATGVLAMSGNYRVWGGDRAEPHDLASSRCIQEGGQIANQDIVAEIYSNDKRDISFTSGPVSYQSPLAGRTYMEGTKYNTAIGTYFINNNQIGWALTSNTSGSYYYYCYADARSLPPEVDEPEDDGGIIEAEFHIADSTQYQKDISGNIMITNKSTGVMESETVNISYNVYRGIVIEGVGGIASDLPAGTYQITVGPIGRNGIGCEVVGYSAYGDNEGFQSCQVNTHRLHQYESAEFDTPDGCSHYSQPYLETMDFDINLIDGDTIYLTIYLSCERTGN